MTLFREIVACSLGIYLVHPLLLRLLEFTGAFARFSDTFWFMPAAAAAIFAASLLLAAMLRHTPFLRRVIA